MQILVLDNYDSFTYNLVHYIEELSDAKVDVFRNDKITVEQAGTRPSHRAVLHWIHCVTMPKQVSILFQWEL